MGSDSVTEQEWERATELEMVMDLVTQAGSDSVKEPQMVMDLVMVTQLEMNWDLDSRFDNSADDRDCTCTFARRRT